MTDKKKQQERAELVGHVVAGLQTLSKKSKSEAELRLAKAAAKASREATTKKE